MVSLIFKAVVMFFISIYSYTVNAALTDGSVLHFNSYGGTSIPVDGNGSWFSVEPDFFGVVGISSFEGLVIGTTQQASGSHSGPPDGSESPAIDNPYNWYGNTGMLSTTTDSNIITASGNTATIDFTGIRWSWNGMPNIVIYDSTGDSGVATVTCALDCGNGDSYILDYTGHIEQGSPAGLGGEEVRIHLEGVISSVPVPAAVWLFTSGLFGLICLARRKI